MKTLAVGLCGWVVAAAFASVPAEQCLAAPAAKALTAPAGKIVITNFKNGETIRYSTPLIMGTLADDKAEGVVLTNKSSKRPTRQMSGLARKGRFKVLADLVPGPNTLTLTCGKDSQQLTIHFKPQTNPRIIRAVYYTNKTGDAGYLSPVANDKQDVAGKLSTAMLLMQSFSAECMNQLGYGRKTFNVDLNEDGTVKVFIVKGNQDPGPGYNGGAVDEAINTQAARPDTSYLVILGKDCGYTAIGGGGKAIMGGSCIYTWPDTIQAAQAAFMDPTAIDTSKFHVDAVSRDVFWANSSTTIGACLHEIDHVLWLPHSMDGFDIMTRGIDYFNRFFTLIEPPSKIRNEPYEFNDGEIARYCRVTANNLSCSRYFALDDVKYTDKYELSVKYEPAPKQIRIKSDLGIAFIGLEVPYANPGADYVFPIDPAKPAPKEVVVPAKIWEDLFHGGPFQVRVIDVQDHGVNDRDPLTVK